MLIAVLSGFIFSFLLVFFGRFLKGKFAVLTALLPLSLFVYFSQYIGLIADGAVIRKTFEWVPILGVNLDFKLDGLSLLFSLMITGIGFLVFAYSSSYLKNHKYLDRFYGYLGFFMAAMLGLVLSDNIISIFLFWELTSISSFFLIGFNNNDINSRRSAVTALSVTAVGGLLLLAAAVILGQVTGTYSISEMLLSRQILLDNELYIIAVLLIFGATFTKSAQFPFHFWLPGAMKAPTPVSTYLHSATMVKAGVYLLMRLSPLMGGEEIWNITLMSVGAVTMLYAAIHALFRVDMKGVLAYSTITALGMLVFLIGIGTEQSFMAAIVFIIVHALYKATLFLITGIVDLKTGTRNLTLLSGLGKVLFPVAIAGVIAAISGAGIPPTVGFVGKDLIYEATLHGIAPIVLTGVAILTNILLLYAGFVVGIKPFVGKLPEQHESLKMPSPLQWVPPLILASLSLIFGIFPGLIEFAFVNPGLSTFGFVPEGHLKLWHGFNFILLLSAITIGVGLLIYFLLSPSTKYLAFIEKFEKLSPHSVARGFRNIIYKLSQIWTETLQNGYLRNYIFTIVFFLVVLMAFSMFNNVNHQLDYTSLTNLNAYQITIALIMMMGILFTVFSNSRLTAVAAMGVVGYSICLLFIYYSAPDLAMTQFAIDTLTVILFVLVLYRLPKYLVLSDNKVRIMDGVLSLSLGLLISLLALEVLNEPVNKEITEFYAENSYKLAKGKNVVNVILVDFRGADTMVEISVLAIAAIGVFGLLKLRLKSSERRKFSEIKKIEK